jgi:hypothetical protein
MTPGKYVIKGRKPWLQYLEIPSEPLPRDYVAKLHDHLGFSYVRAIEMETGRFEIERPWGTEEDLRMWEGHRRLIADRVRTE